MAMGVQLYRTGMLLDLAMYWYLGIYYYVVDTTEQAASQSLVHYAARGIESREGSANKDHASRSSTPYLFIFCMVDGGLIAPKSTLGLVGD